MAFTVVMDVLVGLEMEREREQEQERPWVERVIGLLLSYCFNGHGGSIITCLL